MRHDRIIDVLGGNGVLSKLVGNTPSAVSRWRAGGIPPAHWPLLLDYATASGHHEITLDELRAGLPPNSRYRMRLRKLSVRTALARAEP